MMENQTELMRFTVTNEEDGKQYQVILPKSASKEEIQAAAAKHIDKVTAPSVLESAVAGAGQGIGFNSLDEAYGAVKGGYKSLKEGKPFSGEGGEYRKARDEARQYFDKAQETNPYAYGGGELVGSLAVPMGVEAAALRKGGQIAATLAPKAQTLGRSILENGLYSGVAGLGGSNSDDPSRITQDTISSGVLGAGIGSIAHGVAKPLTEVFGAGRYQNKPTNFAAEKITQNANRDFLGKEHFEEGVNPLFNVQRKLNQEAARGEKNLMVADYAGPNLEGLMRNALDTPNAGRKRFNEVLDRRSMVQASNIENSLKKNLGADKNYFKTIDDLDTEMQAVSKPFFDRMNTIATPDTPELQKVLATPALQKISQKVDEQIANDAFGAPISKIDRLHMIKEYLDDIISNADNLARNKATLPQPEGGAERLAQSFRKLKSDLLRSIDNPYYKEGLRRYAGKATLQNALENGKYDFYNLAPEEIAAKLKDLTPAEQDLYRQGAARSMIDKLSKGKLQNDKTRQIDDKTLLLKLKVIFPNFKNKGEFLRDVSNERLKYQTRQASQGNSTTFRRVKEAEDADSPASYVDTGMDVVNAATGSVPAGVSLVKRILDPMSGYGPKYKAEVLNLLRSKNAEEIGRMGLENALRRQKGLRSFENALAGPVSQISSGFVEPNEGRSYTLYNR